jgi:hypothetical protein
MKIGFRIDPVTRAARPAILMYSIVRRNFLKIIRGTTRDIKAESYPEARKDRSVAACRKRAGRFAKAKVKR